MTTPVFSFGREASTLRQQLQALGTPERAASAKKYLKSDLQFFGCDTGSIRDTAKGFVAAWPGLTRAQLCAFVKHLWQSPVHELRSVGIAILELRQEVLEPADLPLLEELLQKSHSWAYVDWIAVHLVGDLVARAPKLKKELRRWAGDPDFWLRRASLLALLLPLRAGEGDFALFTELAVPMLPDPEEFIRKAIGWVLREASKKQPGLVRAFVQQHGAAMSPLTRREATRRLD
ncbi:MAG TPA: DNA alkylation repair protein [Planctomycetota bacterium]|nr:DNA alkylation repair protein [Planctomycetota bacterium]